MLDRTSIHERAKGRWVYILQAVGVSAKVLSGKHVPCPMCGGDDRFRFDDKEGRGTFFCSHCGAGTGVDLVMKLKGLPDTREGFLDAVKIVSEHVEAAPIRMKVRRDTSSEQRERMTYLWTTGKLITKGCIVENYFKARSIDILALAEKLHIDLTKSLRFNPEFPHKSEDGKRSTHACMFARFVAPDCKSAILHCTWIDAPGVKAAVDKPRKLMPGTVPHGGAVRLGPACEEMGVAEGIETALAAAALYDMPVWSVLNEGNLLKFVPPPECRKLWVFGDGDRNFVGQASAYTLARQVAGNKRDPRDATVAIPDQRYWTEKGGDWNDVLKAELDL